MSSEHHRRRDEKKKPQRTLMEKRADKWAKKDNKGVLVAPAALAGKKR